MGEDDIEIIGVLYSRNTAHNPVQYDRIKHIKFDRQSRKGWTMASIVLHLKAMNQLVNVLTRGVLSRPFNTILSQQGMSNSFAST